MNDRDMAAEVSSRTDTIRAEKRIASFRRQFGTAHLDFACHASFPLALTPDLLYRMWASFQADVSGQPLMIPWIAVADLVLSSLCREVKDELYEMDVTVRRLLLRSLKDDQRFGAIRINELSDFLSDYVRQHLQSEDEDIRDLAQAQQWMATAYTHPNEIARELARALNRTYSRQKPEFLRYASLTEAFAEPLAEYVPLLTYARGMSHFIRGAVDKATLELERIVEQGRQIRVEDVTLTIPKKALEKTHADVPSGQFASTPVESVVPDHMPGGLTDFEAAAVEQYKIPHREWQPPTNTYGGTVPALVIGLGGTGQWVLTYLKKALIETYGQIPRGLRLRAFDTVKTASTWASGQADMQHQDRIEKRTAGGVKLEPGEYIYLGDYVRDYVRDIAQDVTNLRYPHLRSWFQATYYLDNLPDQQFNLDEGAGMFRQFGRLALFHDLRAPTVSKVFNQLMDTVQEIQRDTNTQNLYVFVVGSLVGGTGAGMFVDIAHLVRQIAKEQAHMQVSMRGFLVLPDAFGALPAAASIRRGMNARAFAAMRELERFSTNFDWDLGYPMCYVAPASSWTGDPVLLGSIKGQLFDQLYYFDGHRREFPLNRTPLENGVAPTIADMISAMLDANSFGSFEEHIRNVWAVLASRRYNGKVPSCSSLGTFSIVYPIYHIVEGYAHQLGLEALQQILQPSTVDDRTGLPIRLAGDRNKEAGEGYTGLEAARAFLRSSSIVDPGNPSNAVDNTLLTSDLMDYTERFTLADTSTLDALANRRLEDWDRVYAPTGQSEDILISRQRGEAVLYSRLVQEVPPSKSIRERPADGLYRIENGVRSFKAIYLGREQPENGQRMSGKYSEALGEYANVHLGRFQRMLDYKLREILNGRWIPDPILAKSGKLGHLIEFLDGLSSYLNLGYQVLTRVMERRRSQGYSRLQAIAATQSALNEMRANANDTRPIFGKAHKSQEAYLEAEQTLVNIHKLEIMEQAVTEVVKRMQEMVESAKASADGWAQTLGLGQDSLYAALLAGKRQVDANRDKDADVESRLVLGARKAGKEDAEYRRFREYEEQRYRHYVYEDQTRQMATLLDDLNWQVSTEVWAGKPAIKLGLNIASEASARPVMFSSNTRKNLGVFLDRARQAFKDVIRDESVVKYLMYAYETPEALADLIHTRSEPLLDHNATAPVPARYLRVAHGQRSEEIDYLRRLLRRLADLSYISSLDRFARLVNSENRFACTLINTIDLIELDRITAYTGAVREYMGYTGEQAAQASQRTALHCFPAEVNAVQFEEQLPMLNQAARILNDDIVLQLEKEDNVRLFLFCWGYGLINTYAFYDAEQTKDVYRLQWEAEDERDTGEVWLTKPQKDKVPDLLEALMTFNYVGRDVGHGDAFLKRIEWDKVKATLETRYTDDMAARRAAGTLGASDSALRNWLDAQKVPDEDSVWLLAARLDRLSEMDRKLTEMVAGLDKQLKEPAHRESEELWKQYDLSSVFVLTVRDEQEKLKRRIRGRQRDIQPGPTAAKPAEKGKRPSWDL